MKMINDNDVDNDDNDNCFGYDDGYKRNGNDNNGHDGN